MVLSATDGNDELLESGDEVDAPLLAPEVDEDMEAASAAADRTWASRSSTVSSQIPAPRTTLLEILGWCLYSWASEPFIVSAVGTYVPILLEQIARDNGVKFSDKISPCSGTSHDPEVPYPSPPPPPEEAGSHGSSLVDVGPRMRRLALFARENTNKKKLPDDTCVLPIMNGRFFIDTSSYALYTFSLSVLIQTICVISMSGAADRGTHRKQLLIGFGIAGSLCTMFYWLLRPSSYYMASVLAILANSAYGCVSVCGNSFLSLLVGSTKEIEEIPLDSPDRTRKVGEVSAQISGSGAASGYIAALIVQVGTMFMLIAIRDKLQVVSVITPIKTVIGLVGLWWFVFQFPISLFLKPRASPELKIDNLTREPGTWGEIKYKRDVCKAYILHGYKTLYLAFKQASELRDICYFLIGWFVVSDSMTTINSTAILFARSNLDMNTIQLSRIGVLAMISAIGGSILIPNWLQPRFKLTIKKTLVLVILWAAMIPFYGILGFFFDTFGLHHDMEMYVLAIWYGFSLGGIATISRSMYSMLIPKGQESVFFALFSITDKGSSILGPLLVGVVIDLTHEIRECFWVLLALLLLAIPIFGLVDVDRGVREANVLSQDDIEDDVY